MTPNTAEKDARIEVLQKELCAGPNAPKKWYELGQLLAEQDRFAQCLEAFTKGLCYDPFDPDLRLQRGRKHITMDDYDQAIADLKLAVQLRPGHWENWYYCGVAAYMAGKYELSMELEMGCIRAMQENGIPEIPAAACWYWQSAMKAGKGEDAQKMLDEYIYEGIPCSNMDYTKRCYLYKGILSVNDFNDLDALKSSLVDEDRPDLYFITLCHGLATYCYYNGMEDRSRQVLEMIRDMPTWHECFAYKQTLQDLKERGWA